MSDFLFSTRPCPPGLLQAALTRYLAAVPGVARELHGPWGSLAAFLPSHEAHAIVEDPARITVLVGNPLARLPGLAPRLLHVEPRRNRVHALCADPEARIENVLDGHFALLDIDARTGAGRVLVDRFGFVPVFASAPPGRGLVVGTHVDAVAAAAGCDALDAVSIADFVCNLSCTHPWTVYREVRQLDVAAEHRFSAHAWIAPPRTYWRPVEAAGNEPVEDAAVELREALLEGAAAATGGADRGALLLSGGEDSRAVLGAVPAGVHIRAVTWAESENREVRTARRVARAYGAAHEVGWRTADHYWRHFPQASALVGSHHGFYDVHGFGMAGALGLDAEPVVLGGLSADSLLKLTYWRAPVPWRTEGSLGMRAEVLREVDRRRDALLEELGTFRPASAGEWLSLWPFAMRKHGGNVDGNRRLFRSFEAFHVTRVLEVAARARPEWKRDRVLYHAAMRPLLARARLLPHTKYRFPYYGALGNALLVPALALGRGVRRALHAELKVRHGSWPKWRVVAQGLEPYLLQVLEGSSLPALLARDPNALPAQIAAWPPLRRMLFTQLGWVLASEPQLSSRNAPATTSRMATRPSSMM